MQPRGPRGRILKTVTDLNAPYSKNQFILQLFKIYFMARCNNIFDFTGSIGNLVFYRYRGKLCVRTKPVRKNKIVSPAQAINQKRFLKATEFVRSLTPLINTTIKPFKRMSASNFLVSHVLKNSIFGHYPDFKIDYSLIPVSDGILQRAFEANVTCNTGNLIFTWNNDIRLNNTRENDKVILVAYCENLNQCIYSTNTTIRRTGIATLSVQSFNDREVHTWIAFRSEDGKLTSKSTYTGALLVT